MSWRVRRRLEALDTVRRHLADEPGSWEELLCYITGLSRGRVSRALITLAGSQQATCRYDEVGLRRYTLTPAGLFPLERDPVSKDAES